MPAIYNSTIKKEEHFIAMFHLSGIWKRESNLDGNREKFIGSNLVIFCYEEFWKLVLCKSVSQSEPTFIIYSEPIESGHVKINFS